MTPWERRAPERASLVADLTAAMERDPISPFKVNEDTLEVFTDRLVRAGWRRVTEDPDEIERIARLLVERFSPEDLNTDYRAEAERRGIRLPDPVDTSTLVAFKASDGLRATRPLRFGEVVRAVLAVLRGGEQPSPPTT